MPQLLQLQLQLHLRLKLLQMAWLLDQTSVPMDLLLHLHRNMLLCTTTKEKHSVVPMLYTLTPLSTVLFGAAFNSLATETSVLSSLRQLQMECLLVPEYLQMKTLVLFPTDSLLDPVKVPMVHQHRTPPVQSHARILDLTRNRHIVLFGRNCKALSPPRDPHLCLLQMASHWVPVCHPTAMLEQSLMEAHKDQTSVLLGLLPPHRHYPLMSRKSDVSMQITQLFHPPSVTFGARCKSTAI